MSASNYIVAWNAYVALTDAVADRIGAGPLDPADDAALTAAVAVERCALIAMTNAPAGSLAEIMERAAILAELIENGDWEDHVPALAARIASDLRGIGASPRLGAVN